MTPDRPFFVRNADGVVLPVKVDDPEAWDPDQPCDTCDGTGWKYRDQYGAYYGHTIAQSMQHVLKKAPCPAACTADGRRTAPIITACPKCAISPLHAVMRGGEDDCQEGYVDTGQRCSWTLAPVVKQQGMRTEMTGRWIAIMPNGSLLWQSSDGVTLTTRPERISLPFPVSDGDWVAVPGVTP